MLSQKEKIEGNKLYTKLCGEGFFAKPPYKGGLYQLPPKHKYESCGCWFPYIQSVVLSLSEDEINNVGCLVKMAKDSIKNFRGGRREELITWVTHPKIKEETINRAFTETLDSLSMKEAMYARPTYWIFLNPEWGCANNPWTRENNNQPGYAVIPYFAATREFPKILPASAKDQVAYKKLVEKLTFDLQKEGVLKKDDFGYMVVNQQKIKHLPGVLKANHAALASKMNARG